MKLMKHRSACVLVGLLLVVSLVLTVSAETTPALGSSQGGAVINQGGTNLDGGIDFIDSSSGDGGAIYNPDGITIIDGGVLGEDESSETDILSIENPYWTYTPLPNGYVATPKEGNPHGSVISQVMIKGEYFKKTVTYCPGATPASLEFVEARFWDLSYGLDDYTVVLVTADKATQYDVNASDGNRMPNEPGTYYPIIRVNCLATPLSISPTSVRSTTNATVKIAHTAAEEWTADGDSLVLLCQSCGAELARVRLTDDITYSLCTTPSVTPNVTHLASTGFSIPSYVILYEGIGETEYDISTVQPNEPGTYSMRLALLRDVADPTSATVVSEAHKLTVFSHTWEYASSEYSLTANCTSCGEHAEVTLDTSTIYEASRSYDGGELEYEVFYEDNWSTHPELPAYTVLYNGIETVSENSTEVYTDAFSKPRKTGNYTATLALLSDPDNEKSAWLSTKEKPYYLADIDIYSVSTLTYGPTQKIQLTEPKTAGGLYQVGTLSELLWCLYNKNADANIYLTNDIVVNPITINDRGEIRSASYQIYLWEGFGTEKTPYRGTICGNGYTIYGLYHPDADGNPSGFINCGQGCTIYNLYIENSMLNGTYSGAVIGHYVDVTTSSGYTGYLDDARSLYCYLTGSLATGGIIGGYTGNGQKGICVYSCNSDSYVGGPAQYGAGGIIGRIEKGNEIVVDDCVSFGNVSSGSANSYAGGIIGSLSLTKAYAEITHCFNLGTVTSSSNAGGVIGFVETAKNTYALIENCTSTGYLYPSAQQGGIVGYFTSYATNYDDPNYTSNAALIINNDFFYNASSAFGKGCKTNSIPVTKLSKSQVTGGFVCSHYEHIASTHRVMTSMPDCVNDGGLVLNCAICGSVLESKTIHSHGHRYEYGQCIYCGEVLDDEEDEEEDWWEASIFGYPNVLVTVIASTVLVVIAVVWIVVKKKKNKTEAKTEAKE